MSLDDTGVRPDTPALPELLLEQGTCQSALNADRTEARIFKPAGPFSRYLDWILLPELR